MEAFRIGKLIIIADIREEAEKFYVEETGEELPLDIEEISVLLELPFGENSRAVKDLMNDELDRRNQWLRMGVPCDLHWPFIVYRYE